MNKVNSDNYGLGEVERVTAYRPRAFAGRMAPKNVDERFSSTNTNYGGEDPGKVEDLDPVATFNPE